MACPSGCINGGAQPRPPPGADPREYAAGVTAALAAASAPEDADAQLQRVYSPPAPNISTGWWYCFDMVNRYSLLGVQGVGSAAARQVRRPPAQTPVAASRAAVLPHGVHGRACAECGGAGRGRHGQHWQLGHAVVTCHVTWTCVNVSVSFIPVLLGLPWQRRRLPVRVECTRRFKGDACHVTCSDFAIAERR